jgi:hypothetical protein
MWNPEEEREWFGDLISRGGAREFGLGEAIGGGIGARSPMPATALMNIKKRKEWHKGEWKDAAVFFLERFGWIPSDIHTEMMLSESNDHSKRYIRLVDESKVVPAIDDDLLMKVFLEEKSNWNRKNYRSPLLSETASK